MHDTRAIRDLHGIAVHHCDKRIVIEQCVFEVDITDDVAFPMNRIHCNGEVAGSAVEMPVIQSTMFFGTLLRLKEIIEVVGLFDFGHGIAHKLFAGVQDVGWPCDGYMIE